MKQPRLDEAELKYILTCLPKQARGLYDFGDVERCIRDCLDYRAALKQIVKWSRQTTNASRIAAEVLGKEEEK